MSNEATSSENQNFSYSETATIIHTKESNSIPEADSRIDLLGKKEVRWSLQFLLYEF